MGITGGKGWLAGAVGMAVLVMVAALAATRLCAPATYEAQDFGIEVLRSASDHDLDGIDDQTDILASARAYVAQAPAYESAYYETGRPNDGRGVCTDVVDRALLGAGFDLQSLMDEDIRASPEAYGIDVIDANIDFRRVANQRVWFDRHAQSLTTDPRELGQWQGGDIVAWGDHVGIVSSSRNAVGVALVIHHASPFQARYEEDVLASSLWGPIVGHWRMG